MSSVLDATQDSEVDVRTVGLLGTLGFLADDVLADLHRAESAAFDLSKSEAIRAAASIFSAAATSSTEPAQLWEGAGLSEALRRMAAVPAPNDGVTPSANSGSWGDRLQRISESLDAAVQGGATAEQRSLLARTFTAMANGTMDASLGSLHVRGHASSWLTL